MNSLDLSLSMSTQGKARASFAAADDKQQGRFAKIPAAPSGPTATPTLVSVT